MKILFLISILLNLSTLLTLLSCSPFSSSSIKSQSESKLESQSESQSKANYESKPKAQNQSKSKSKSKSESKSQLGVSTEILNQVEQGQKIYLNKCAVCHQSKGEGIINVYPPLANSDWLKKDVKSHAMSSIKNGKKGLITVNGVNYDGVMPPQLLSDLEIANVLTYIFQSLNGRQITVTEDEVKAVTSKTSTGVTIQ